MFPELHSARFLMRKIVPSDKPLIFQGLSDPRVIAYYGVSYASLDAVQEQMDWFDEIYAAGTGVWWGICNPNETNILLGAVGLNDFCKKHKRAEIGFWLLPKHWGQGVASEAVSAILPFAFNEMGVHRIGAEVDIENVRSSDLLKGIGFIHDGIRRDYEIDGDRKISISFYSLLSTDFAAQG